MQSGYVFCDLNNKQVLCYTSDRQRVELIPIVTSTTLNKAICLGDLTEMKNIQERFKKAGMVGEMSIVNIGSLYKKFF